MAREATVQELAEALKGPTPPVLVDVRTPAEFSAERVEGARNVPLGDLGSVAGSLPKDRPVWVMCLRGHRSAAAVKHLEHLGLDVVDVQGGLNAWQRAALPVVGTGPRFPMMPLLVSLSLGLAPFTPEPHLVGKLRWVAGGAVGMGPMDWFDLLLHGGPWLWLAWSLVKWVSKRASAAQARKA